MCVMSYILQMQESQNSSQEDIAKKRRLRSSDKDIESPVRPTLRTDQICKSTITIIALVRTEIKLGSSSYWLRGIISRLQFPYSYNKGKIKIKMKLSFRLYYHNEKKIQIKPGTSHSQKNLKVLHS